MNPAHPAALVLGPNILGPPLESMKTWAPRSMVYLASRANLEFPGQEA